MIITVTLNPAIDKTMEIDNFKVGSINRESSIRLDAGGKGINVSKVIHSLKENSRAVGILAGRNGEFIKKYMDLLYIENDFLFIEGESRINTKIVDRINHTNTDINERGTYISQGDLNNVSSKVFHDTDDKTIIVLSGSVPDSVDKNIYGNWITKSKEKGAKIILDADGELLKNAIEKGPYLVKPNISELERLFSRKIATKADAIECGKKIFDYGVEIVVISLGGEGSIFMNKKSTVIVDGIKVQVVSTVGAGDAMVAALAVALDKGYTFEKAITLSAASGTANVMTKGTEASKIETIMELEKQVKLQYV